MTPYGVDDGEYAVAMIHDENGNSQLCTTILGVPRDEIAVSNNSILIGSATYSAAKLNKGQTCPRFFPLYASLDHSQAAMEECWAAICR